MWILDLCSGLGGWTEPFIENPQWEVVRIENNIMLSGVPETRCLNVLEWMDWLPELIEEMGRPDVIVASPPCDEFTQAFGGILSRSRREGIEFEPSMDIVEACIDIIQYSGPTFWVIENVNGACPWFMPELGKHKQKIGPFLLWGGFPIIHIPDGYNPHKADNDTWSTDPLRANKKAFIPREISEGLLDAISSQSTLADWI